TIQTYIGESPFTQTMPEQSPGNIGPWIGWQIVKKFVANNSSFTPEQVMKTDAKKILEEAKYKPK
ncbi:MAG: gliding motility lipoprotein GldB, partial [Bacteroidetes bacterium]|nr:gliding motility lipoprotein GldB [Bacteroidota bacterium]